MGTMTKPIFMISVILVVWLFASIPLAQGDKSRKDARCQELHGASAQYYESGSCRDGDALRPYSKR